MSMVNNYTLTKVEGLKDIGTGLTFIFIHTVYEKESEEWELRSMHVIKINNNLKKN